MANLVALKQPDDVLLARDRVHARTLNRAVEHGELTRVSPGIYARSGTPAEVEQRVRQNWQRIAAALVPNAVVSYLSAFARGVTEHNEVTLAHPTLFNREVKLPGLKLVVLRGPAPLPGDLKLGELALYWASRPRMLLDNLGRRAKDRPRKAGREAVEEQLVSILAASGETALNRLRDDARGLALVLNRERESKFLEQMISALLGTHAAGKLRTRAGQLVSQGTPADAERLVRFELLAVHLRVAVLPSIPDVAASGLARNNFAFFESYFSNYIEGTKFSVDEAAGIALENRIVAARPKDSHDILGVFKMALNPPSRDTVPAPGIPFVEGLQQRHALMLERRPEIAPGELKHETNFAGTTAFVAPEFVRGTLIEGSKLALSIPEGLARAAYYGFLVSEVHPFNDGNGRLSRLFMNAELSRVGQCRVIIPTLFHAQYVDCQRALSRNNEPGPFVSAIEKMARWTATFDFADLAKLRSKLEAALAMEDSPTQYRLLDGNGVRVA
jgi:hypothetical protein